jgi:type IV pilus assembly protein PilV
MEKVIKVYRIRNNKGFTLIEIMVAIFILVVALLGVAAVTVSVINGNAFSKDITSATTLAQDKIEELKDTAYDSIVSGSDTSSIYTRTWTVTSPITDSKTIVVVVSWSRGGNTRNVTLRSIVTR